jgi:hypothetical protein
MTMKIFFFIQALLLFLVCSLMRAQLLTDRLIVGLSVGVSTPVRNFGKADTVGRKDTSKVKGWAKTGIDFNVKAGFRLTKHIGAMVQAAGGLNGFNTTAYLNQNYNTPILQGAVAVNAKDYYIGSYLVGPFFNFPINSMFDIEGRVLAGLMTANYSPITSIIVWDGATYTYNESYKSAHTLGYDAGIVLKYKLMDQIGFTLSADYLGGNPTFSEYSLNYTGPTITSVNYTGPSTTPPNAPVPNTNSLRTSSMSIGILNFNFGAVFSFF